MPHIFPLALHLFAAPPADPPNIEDFRAVNKVAREITPSLRCTPEMAVSEQTLSTMRDYERAGTLNAVLALETTKLEWLPTLIDQTIENFDWARECSPAGRRTELLARAFEFLADMENKLHAQGSLHENKLALVRIREHRARLNRIAAEPPKPPPSSDPPPALKKPKFVPEPEAPPKRRVLEYFSLQFRLGVGQTVLWSDFDRYTSNDTAAHLGVAAGARFLAGQRHSIGLGFTWGMNTSRLTSNIPFSSLPSHFSTTSRYATHQIGVYLRYGVYLVPRAFSLHVEGGLGQLGFPAIGSFSDTSLHIGGLLCVWVEAFCLRTEGFRGSDVLKSRYLDTAQGWNLAFVVDPLRLIQHRLERRATQ